MADMTLQKIHGNGQLDVLCKWISVV